MLGQKLEVSLKSQTLPKLDGQDEDGEVLEDQFEILSVANSCPDLSIIEENGIAEEEDSDHDPLLAPGLSNGLSVGNVRRSASLSSFGADCPDGHQPRQSERPHSNQYGTAPTIPVGHTHRHVPGLGQQYKGLSREPDGQLSSSDFARTALRASDGNLQKSISSPSVAQYFVGVGPPSYNYSKLSDISNKSSQKQRVQSDAHQFTTKRSFFRRKKTKSNLSQVPRSNSSSSFRPFKKMEVMSSSIPPMNGDDFYLQSHAFAALQDPTLGLQEADAECWALSMSSELVSQLEDKEVKRQEHMYELILTEKHHCLTLVLMQHLFVGDMKRAGYGQYAKLMFPELNKLLDVHFSFLRKMRERQAKFRDVGQPMDTLSDILLEQFTTDQYHLMIRLYGLYCASHTKSLTIFKDLLKDPKFASLVAAWDKEALLGRKNVRECLLFVAQRITKYPLLIEPILKTSRNASQQERENIERSLDSSKELISKVNERVAQRERLLEICQKVDSKSFSVMGQKRIGRDYLVSLPSRRLLFQGQAIVNCIRVSSVGGTPVNKNFPCTVLILTDSVVFMQEISLKFQFVSPPGIVMLTNLMVRENAGHPSSFFLFLGPETAKPEMIELQAINPPDGSMWIQTLKEAKAKCVDEADAVSDGDDDLDADVSDLKVARALEELQEQDKQLLGLLRARSKLVDTLRNEKPYHWMRNNFDGKDSLLTTLSAACSEAEKVLYSGDANATNGIILRSASCVGEHVSQAAMLGLPKRADTFGGFDSQQRSVLELTQSAHNRLLLDMMTQLHHLCGEIFSQMIPQLMPSVYQTHHQLQRRMEELREAQQRLETEKALFQQDLGVQRENLKKEKEELTALKQHLHREQEDITQQREQLYRKLEALQKQGIRPPLDSISPVSLAEKSPTNPITARRPLPPTASSSSISASSANQPSQNGLKSKQQLPLFLASNSSFKAGKNGGGLDLIPAHLRSSVIGSLKGSSSSAQIGQTSDIGRPPSTKSAQSNSKNSASGVQQLLPLRLSEGNSSSNKTASLPRGVGSRSVSSILNHLESSQQHSGNTNQQFRNSTGSSPYGNGMGERNANQPGTSFPYGSTFHDPQDQGRVPYHGDNDNNGVSVIHRRSGSSPVPMSTFQPNRNHQPPEPRYHQYQHPFFRPRDDDGEKILFL